VRTSYWVLVWAVNLCTRRQYLMWWPTQPVALDFATNFITNCLVNILLVSQRPWPRCKVLWYLLVRTLTFVARRASLRLVVPLSPSFVRVLDLILCHDLANTSVDRGIAHLARRSANRPNMGKAHRNGRFALQPSHVCGSTPWWEISAGALRRPTLEVDCSHVSLDRFNSSTQPCRKRP
jgi:hypothetical protein